ncbi:2-C-methyl-D-erythritol 4-phosphate cytidylyltransferase [Crocinitomix catalasitica]|uniref:2-C-methyl-D-erythritol 4-phosphate cytidylyltransferase n=1 Tax=Crocinitomix catalasitica TaxID=184607 RepID=UPI000485767C|nr:2-C-methyl-D-erythritol 4-phosphate cytidylyltransferase [Crocinitomix catalasitica]
MNTIIITAGGIGKRMGAAIPKQFILLNGKPILMWTIRKFYEFDTAIEIILVLPEAEVENWQQLCTDYNFSIQHQVVVGGKERFDSVKNGLKNATGSWIGVHDAVRPLVDLTVIKNCYSQVEKLKAVIPVVQLKDSIRTIDGDFSTAEDRSGFRLVQTPQVFESTLLKAAYQQSFSTLFTDDASVVESNKVNVHLIDGNEENIKITTKNDLLIASALLNQSTVNS